MKKYNVLALALATTLTLGACGNQNEPAETTEENTTNQTETVEETTPEVENEAETTEEVVEEETANKKEEDEESEAPNEDQAVEEETEETEETSTNETSESNVVLHRAYPDDSSRSFATVVVATSGDKIVDAVLDEYQFFGDDEGFEGVPNSDKGFGEGAKEGRILASKIQNKQPYSEAMLNAGGEVTLMDNYNAVTDFVKGKTIAELETFLDENDDEAIIDALSGATFKATPNLLRFVVEAAKSEDFTSLGNAENPDDVKLQYAIGAPHGERSFGNAVVAVEGDKIIAASIDEYQYLDAAKGVPSSDADFGKDYADSNIVLASKLENDDIYSELMTEKAESTISLKDNYTAIENFAVGKTIDELKEVIASATPGEAIDAVTGATLVDTAGYLQLIVDAAEKDIRAE